MTPNPRASHDQGAAVMRALRRTLAVARRVFDERRLPVQHALAGLGATAAGAGLTGWWLPTGLALGVALGGMLATLAASALALRSADGLHGLVSTGRTIQREGEAGQTSFVLDKRSDEMRQLTRGLQALVQRHREQLQALQASNRTLGQRLDQRTNELSSLQDLSIGLSNKSEVNELVDEALQALAQTVDYDSASVWTRDKDHANVVLLGYRSADPDAPAGADPTGQRLSRQNAQAYAQIEQERAPIIVNDARQSLLSWLWLKVIDDAPSSALYRGTRAWMALPLKFRDEVLGVLRVDHHVQGYFDPERAKLLTAIGSQAALAIHHARLQQQQRLMAVVAERNRIARELHDAVSQTLFAARLQAGTLAKVIGSDAPIDPPDLQQRATGLERLIQGALSEMRMLMFELRPDALQGARLADLLQHAIGALHGRGEFSIEQRLAADEPLSDEVRTHVYRIAQEAIANVGRHSGAQHVLLEWNVEPKVCATLRVVDDGQGFDPGAPRPGHFGLDNMQSRADAIGARLSILTHPGQGSEVQLRLDLAAAAPP